MDNFQKSLILTRVLNSGIIMSIEKNDKELPGLEKLIKKETGYRFVSLVNSYTAAIHSALVSQGIVHGQIANLEYPSETEVSFINWLGVKVESVSNLEYAYQRVLLKKDIEKRLGAETGNFKKDQVFIIDFSELGFGPCAAVVTNDENCWKRSERLKIFGAFDLRTMWTREESERQLQPAIQFNYRLSPLVAACVRLSCMRSR